MFTTLSVILRRSSNWYPTAALKMTLTINNIFDKVGPIGYYSGGFEFIPTSQGDDYSGRQVFLTINYKLD